MITFIKRMFSHKMAKHTKREELKNLLKTYGLSIVYKKDTSITLSCLGMVPGTKPNRVNLTDTNGNVLEVNIKEVDVNKFIKQYEDAAKKQYPDLPKDKALAKYLDELAEIRKVRRNLISKVPGIRDFNKWFDDLTPKEFDILWGNILLRRTVERRLRYPGGFHEWLMVSRANVFKKWDVKANEIRTLRTKISEVIFKNPSGKHGGKGSTKAHNEILKIIDNSNNYDEFVSELIKWAENRLEGGSRKLPKGFFD